HSPSPISTFFFQAEDGIRDGHVTGVQTCALPISNRGAPGLKGGRATIGATLLDVEGGFTDDILQQETRLNDPFLAIPQLYVAYRSEERRVGKECRSRECACH